MRTNSGRRRIAPRVCLCVERKNRLLKPEAATRIVLHTSRAALFGAALLSIPVIPASSTAYGERTAREGPLRVDDGRAATVPEAQAAALDVYLRSQVETVSISTAVLVSLERNQGAWPAAEILTIGRRWRARPRARAAVRDGARREMRGG